MVIALKKAMMREDQFFALVSQYPEDAPEWLTPAKFEQGGVYAFDPDLTNGSADTLRHIKDWIGGALKENDPWVNDLDDKGRPKALMQIGSLADAYSKADKAMRAKASQLREEFANTGAAFKDDEAAGLIKTVKNVSIQREVNDKMQTEDGWRIVQLLSAKALDVESAQLGHCIGNGNYDDKVANTDRYQYYSLRGPNNKAHGTLEFINGVLTQCKGKENAPHAPTISPRSKSLLRRINGKSPRAQGIQAYLKKAVNIMRLQIYLLDSVMIANLKSHKLSGWKVYQTI